MERMKTVGESEKGNDTLEVENDEQFNSRERKEQEENSQPRGGNTKEDTNLCAKNEKRWDKNKNDIIVGHRLWRWQIEINI